MTATTLQQLTHDCALPNRVQLWPTCRAEVRGDHLYIAHRTREVRLPGPDTLAGYSYRHLLEGSTFDTSALAPRVQRSLVGLANRGMLSAPDQLGAEHSDHGSEGINTVGWMTEALNAMSEDEVSTTDCDERFEAGDLPQDWVQASFLEQFHFTRSAPWHITPVLAHALSPRSREALTQFLHEETPHFRIWRPAFSHFGWNFERVLEQVPRESTAWFIESFRSAAEHSELSYLAVLMKVEESPIESHYSDKPYFRTLMIKYAVPESVIRPLWWHATENAAAGHTYMPATLMSLRGRVTRDELDDARGFLHRHLLALRDLHDDIYQNFSVPGSFTSDLT